MNHLQVGPRLGQAFSDQAAMAVVGQMLAAQQHHRRWLELLEASSWQEQKRLRAAMCDVLGVFQFAGDDLLELKLIADRRTAEQLAVLYFAALGGPS